MAKKTQESAPTQVEKNVGEILSKTDQFVDKYLKQTIIAIAAIIVIVVGIFAFHRYYLVPKAQEAQTAIYPAQNYFESQQWELALNGDSIGNIGFLDVIDEFGGTPSANLAKAYAGICEYNLKDYEAARKHLKGYSGKDQLFTAQVIGAIGDCDANLGDLESAVSYFNKAAAKANSSSLSPVYLNKAGLVYERLGNYKKALEAYQTLKSNYPQSPEAMGVDKYIERAKASLK
jgi:tetratricopeptide (TPR) repeat protein